MAALQNPETNPFARQNHRDGLARWIPLLATLRGYQRGWLWRDLAAGLALTALLVPAGMSYAAASGLPAIYGLYATIVPLIAYVKYSATKPWNSCRHE
ncbi:MAG: SulP family inorganic anion transporter [Smithellaceae bacterium]|nr:SulP family inorganic anion transporter [Smithellaceae bacterium]